MRLTDAQRGTLNWLFTDNYFRVAFGWSGRTKKEFFYPSTLRSLERRGLIKISKTGSVRITRTGIKACKKIGMVA
jgi:hypothetical protein